MCPTNSLPRRLCGTLCQTVSQQPLMLRCQTKIRTYLRATSGHREAVRTTIASVFQELALNSATIDATTPESLPNDFSHQVETLCRSSFPSIKQSYLRYHPLTSTCLRLASHSPSYIPKSSFVTKPCPNLTPSLPVHSAVLHSIFLHQSVLFGAQIWKEKILQSKKS